VVRIEPPLLRISFREIRKACSGIVGLKGSLHVACCAEQEDVRGLLFWCCHGGQWYFSG
jgi:hypothetical protein